jgi:hypothetical protein
MTRLELQVHHDPQHDSKLHHQPEIQTFSEPLTVISTSGYQPALLLLDVAINAGVIVSNS